MKDSMESGRRSFKAPILMLTILGIHVAAAGFFMMMSGCTTKPQASVEPPPAPILPPRHDDNLAAPAPIPGATFKPPMSVERAPSSMDALGSGSYTIQKGDSLSRIAARAGVSAREISELNNITDPNKIRIGQKILLPAHAQSLPQAAASAPERKASAKPSAPAKSSGETHVVQSGDTLGKLASRYGTTVAAFKSVNNLKNDSIRIGQKLQIPGATKTEKAPSDATAKKETTKAKSEPAPAPAVAEIVAPAPASPVESSVDTTMDAGTDAETPFPYTVKEGETLDTIAIKFSAQKDVIMRLNKLTSESVSPGQKLLIPWQ